MPYSDDESIQCEHQLARRGIHVHSAYNDWLNVRVEKGDRIHLGYFPDKQRLSVITCCSAGSGQADGFGCPCLQVGNGVCKITILFGGALKNNDRFDACDNCGQWNSRAFPLYPPVSDPDGCVFRAQQTGNPESRSWNSFEYFPCANNETDQPTWIESTVSCVGEDDIDITTDLIIDGQKILQAVWDGRALPGTLSQPDEIYGFPRDIPGISTEAETRKINRSSK